MTLREGQALRIVPSLLVATVVVMPGGAFRGPDHLVEITDLTRTGQVRFLYRSSGMAFTDLSGSIASGGRR